MTKKAKLSVPTGILADELLQLNQLHADIALAKEKFEHTITKGHLLTAMHDVARLQSEVNLLKNEMSVRLKAEQQLAAEKEALTHRQAKDAQLRDLAGELKNRYGVGEKFAIDPLTGEFINLEA